MANSGMAHYNFPNTIRGDTFDGILFTITVNAIPADLTNAHIKMDLRLTPLGIVADTFSDGSGITISGTPTDGKFTFDAQVISIAAANYYYDIEITFSNGVIKTYIGGRWNILQDVSYV
jgi:hypothetical protein